MAFLCSGRSVFTSSGSRAAGQIAQAHQFLSRLLIHGLPGLVARSRGLEADDPGELLSKILQVLAGGQVLTLVEVLAEVVEFGDRRIDEFIGFENEPGEGSPAHVEKRRERFEVDRSILPASSPQQGQERRPLEDGGLFEAKDVANGREDVHVGDVPGNDAVLFPGKPDDQGDPKRGVVGQIAVRFFSVLPERLAMIAGQDDKGCRKESGLFEMTEQSSQHGICISDLAVIGILRVLGPIRFGRHVRVMGIEAVNPEEPGRRPPLEPVQGNVQDGLGTSLAAGIDSRVSVLLAEIIVIDVEVPAESEP
jgi:hypothetical protein